LARRRWKWTEWKEGWLSVVTVAAGPLNPKKDSIASASSIADWVRSGVAQRKPEATSTTTKIIE
jgi:hypothetical protein